MTRLLLTALLLSIGYFVHAQVAETTARKSKEKKHEKKEEKEKEEEETDELERADAYKVFIGRIISTNNNASLTPSVVFSVGDKSSLDIALPIYPFAFQFKDYDNKKGIYETEAKEKYEDNRIFFFANARLTSSDKYTPLLQKGEWKPDAEAGGSFTWLFHRSIKFYKAEIEEGFTSVKYPGLKFIAPIGELPIYKASQVNFWWLNIRGGYKYSVNALFDTTGKKFSEAAFDSVAKGAYVSANVNWYLFPSKMKTPWLTWYWQAGIDYAQNGTNLTDLDKVKGTITKTYSQNGVDIEEVIKEVDARKFYSKKDSFKVGWTIDIPVRANFIFNSPDHNFYFGVGYYFNHRIWTDKNRTDMGFNLNVPITQKKDDKKSLVNFQLQFLWQDIKNLHKPEEKAMSEYRRENFSIGFTVAAPLMLSHRRFEKEKKE